MSEEAGREYGAEGQALTATDLGGELRQAGVGLEN